MRLRKVKNAKERLMVDDNKYFISEPNLNKGNWNKVFNNDNPIHIEIGCGKGQFITTLAEQNKDINYVAIEKFDSVLLRVLEKIIDKNYDNLKICVIDAATISEYFDKDEVSRIYLNFSDPWPKRHHAKRRLTHENFLNEYKKILKADGEIHFKTDNRGLFEFSLESFNKCNWNLSNISLDLHKDLEKYPFNITTEFEDKWSKLGPIYRLEASYKK
ncbi:MAG: tRNA (guanosine(46)-N7)-methyltransferase TrmB [Acholeplasmatales bacterium]|nr:tRNA (guanosine(46)-N7)-methyltransferase TrmB [Acholeplasmatales bacterium]